MIEDWQMSLIFYSALYKERNMLFVSNTCNAFHSSCTRHLSISLNIRRQQIVFHASFHLSLISMNPSPSHLSHIKVNGTHIFNTSLQEPPRFETRPNLQH